MIRGLFFSYLLWFVVLVASIAAYVHPGETTQPDTYVATAVKKTGEVSYRGPFSSNWKRISDGMKLAAGTAISTKTNGSIVLEKKDGHILNIASNSQIVLSGLDRSQRGKTQVFLVSGAVSMKPTVPKQSESEGLFKEIKTALSSSEMLSNILERAERGENKKIEVVAGSVRLDVTQAKSPIAVSSNAGKIDVLTKDPNVTARIGNESQSVLPANKALGVANNAGDLVLTENVETQLVENLQTLSEQAEQEAQDTNRKQSLADGTREPDKNNAPDPSLQNKTSTLPEPFAAEKPKPVNLDRDLSESKKFPVVAPKEQVKSVLAQRSDRSAPIYAVPRENRPQQKASRSVSTAALAPPSSVPTTMPATPSPFAIPTPAPPTSTPIANSTSATPPLTTTPTTQLWQLIKPQGGVVLLPPDINSLRAMDSIKFEYKYLGTIGSEKENQSLEILDKANSKIRIFISPEQNNEEEEIRRFQLSGDQLSDLVTRSKGSNSFSYRLVTAGDSSNGVASSSNAETIELKALDAFSEGTYSISARIYKPSRPDQAQPLLILENDEANLSRDKVEFVAQSRSALKTILSRVAFEGATSLKQSQQSSEQTIGTHFVDGSSLMFSVFPAQRAEESLKSQWLSSAPERIVFEGKISDFIRPESIISALREGMPNQTIQFVSAGKIFSTRLVILQRLPGAAKLLAQERVALFKSKEPLRVGISMPGSTLIAKPSSSFAQSPVSANRGIIGSVLLASKGNVSFPTLEQIGFSSPTLFNSIPRAEVEKFLKSKKFVIDKTIRQYKVATALFSLFAENLKANLLLIVSEQPDGELTGELYGKTHTGTIVNRSFSAKGISELQRLFFRSLDYDGIVTASERKWINILSHGDAPSQGQWAAIYGKAQSNIWLPVIDRGEIPTALARCEMVQRQGCWARIFSIEKLATETDLVGAKSKWL